METKVGGTYVLEEERGKGSNKEKERTTGKKRYLEKKKISSSPVMIMFYCRFYVFVS